MAFSRILEDRSTSRSQRYTMEDSDISVALVMEVFNDEPSMYLIVSYPLDSFLVTKDLFYHEALKPEVETEIEGSYVVHFIGFSDPLLAFNKEEQVFNKALSFVVNELYRLSELNVLRKTSHKPQ